MEIGREFQCEIEKTVFGGDGLARVGGEVVFIPRTLPGERLIARVTACKSSFSRAEAVRFGATSPHRIEPACPYFGRCPGCRYLHAGYAYETELKAAQLADQLAQAGLEPAPGVLESPIAPEPPLGYRNKIVLHVHKVGGRTMLGYVMGDNTTVTDIEACPLAHPEINAKLAELRGDKSFLHSLHEGMDVTFRWTAADGAIYWRNQPARNATWLKEELPFGRLSVPCGSFFQVNAAGAAALADEVAALIAARKPARFIDLYAGAGFFSAVALHAGVREVLAVESDEAAAAAARFNLKRFGAEHPEVIAGDAAEALKSLKDAPASDALLTVDPPRGGLTLKAAMALTGSTLDSFIYISCNPATWARDARRLAKGGFTLSKLRLVNMFPRTEHFELFSFWTR